MAGIAGSDGIFLTNRLNRTVAMDLLDQQYQMIMPFKGLDEHFSPFVSEDLFREETMNNLNEEWHKTIYETSTSSAVARFPESIDLLKMALDLAEKTRRLPSRLRWGISDPRKMESLLSRLAAMNDSLRDMLGSHRAEILRTQQIRTNYNIIQLNNQMEQLIDIIRAGSAPLTSDQPGPRATLGVDDLPAETKAKRLEPSVNSDSMHHLVKLAQLKAVACAVQEHNLDDSVRSKIGTAGSGEASQNKPRIEASALDLDLSETMMFFQGADARRGTGRYYPPIRDRKRRRVWVEWKSEALDPFGSARGLDAGTLRRLEAAVSLLREGEVTAQFRVPKCLGYYQGRDEMTKMRYGLVFENPRSAHAGSSPLSLRDLITDRDRATPSLTSRVHLMRILVESVEKLNAVDWLHKDLRSDNVIFFHRAIGGENDGKSVDFSEPYLTGFDYSSPLGSASMSEGLGTSLADDLYRHPDVQYLNSDDSTGHRLWKRHDVYSLGLTLTEIAYWKPLESIIGISRLQDLKPEDVLGVREVLLSQSQMESLQSRVGDTISQACWACLEGLNTSGQPEKEDDDTVDAEQHQMKFYETVVRPFSALVI